MEQFDDEVLVLDDPSGELAGDRLSISLRGRSFSCIEIAPPSKIVSFLERIYFHDGEDPCWEWMASRTRLGYAEYHWNRRHISAYRFAWILFVGPLDPAQEVHHKCFNPSCVNPDHLQPLTKEEHDEIHAHSNPVRAKLFETHCQHGHPFSEENTRIFIDGRGNAHRRCKTCQNLWQLAKWRRRNPQAPRIERTHCPKGHELSGDNLYEYMGAKQCKTCHNVNSAKYYEGRLSPRAVPRPPKPPKTHCKNGHPWTPENLYTYLRDGQQAQICGICRKIAGDRTYQRRKEKFGKQ